MMQSTTWRCLAVLSVWVCAIALLSRLISDLDSLRLVERRNFCLVGMGYYRGLSIFALGFNGMGKVVLIVLDFRKRARDSCLLSLLLRL